MDNFESFENRVILGVVILAVIMSIYSTATDDDLKTIDELKEKYVVVGEDETMLVRAKEKEEFLLMRTKVISEQIFENSVKLFAEGRTKTLEVGNTLILPTGTVTLTQISNGKAGLLVSPDKCSSRDGQTPFCRGEAACCGGTCVELPNCENEFDGIIFTCGKRDMYCCNQKLSFYSC